MSWHQYLDSFVMSGNRSKADPPVDTTRGETVPAEEPPPYTLVAEEGTVTLETPQGPTNSQSSDSTHTSSASAFRPPPNPPPRPVTQQSEHYVPPPRPPPRPSSQFSGSAGPASPSPAPSQYPQFQAPPPQGHTYPYNNYHPHQGYSHPQNNYQPPPGPPLNYPPGYWCPRCHNTGIKQDKGTTCKKCYEKFGVGSQQIHHLPYGAAPVFSGPPRVVRPGDPSIGGVLCGRCRGSGVIHDLFIFEDACPVCQGVGRVFR